MYCIKCGVELSDAENTCPLCGTTVIKHPELKRKIESKQYPPKRYQSHEIRPFGWLFIITALFIITLLTVFICDFQLNDRVSWSGYVIGALITFYVTCVLPFWFKNANPVIFVPIGFAVLGLYLWYINYTTKGAWFLSFALPVVSCIGFIVTTMVVLIKYIKRGQLYIFGGGSIALGGFMLLLEFLFHITFNRPIQYWSLVPLGVFVLLGLFLFFVAIHRPTRELLERKLFF